MSPAGGALVLASTACAQIAGEPRVRVPLDEAGLPGAPGLPGDTSGRGRSAVLITSCTSEDWLGGHPPHRVGGLASHEVTGYAGNSWRPARRLRSGRDERGRFAGARR
jgi:hypothetical protein